MLNRNVGLSTVVGVEREEGGRGRERETPGKRKLGPNCTQVPSTRTTTPEDPVLAMTATVTDSNLLKPVTASPQNYNVPRPGYPSLYSLLRCLVSNPKCNNDNSIEAGNILFIPTVPLTWYFTCY